MSEWQPIETAPKDGSAFLGATFRNDRWSQRVMWWDEHFDTGDWDEVADDITYRGAWSAGRVGSWNYEEYAEEHPTHWQPLPAPPVPA